MMRSLSSAVGGLRSHQTKMDVIGNNIANVNTYGFKSSRVTFSDVYYQNLNAASAPGTSTGGTNPTQIGYGATVATIDLLNTQSGMASTDRALDLYINGDGMIAVKDPNGNLRYSRLGILGFDAAGNLVDSKGNFVMGFPMNADGTPQMNPDGSVDIDDLTPIKCPPEMLDAMTGISIGSTGDIIGVMPGDTQISTSKALPAWLVNVTASSGNNFSGDIGVQLTLNQSIVTGASPISTSTTLNADWINKVTAAEGDGISGNYTFTYNQISQKITATGPNGEVFSGDYKKGASVQLRNELTGELGFTINTSPSATPNAGSNTSLPLGSVHYSLADIIAVTTTDMGGATNTVYMEYDKSVLGQKDYTLSFGGAGSVTLTIDTNKVTEYNVAKLTYDESNSFSSWLKLATYQGNEQYAQGALNIALETIRVNKFSISSSHALNFLDKTKFQNYLNTLNLDPADGPYGICIEQNTGNPAEFKLVIVNQSGVTTGHESDYFEQGTGLDIEFSGTAVGKAPNATPVLNEATYSNLITVTDQQTITAFVGGTPLGSTVYDGGRQIVIQDPNGDKIVLDVANAGMLQAGFPAYGGTAVSSNVGAVATKIVSDLNFNNTVASATAGDGQKVYIGNIALAKVPNMAAMEQYGDSYYVTSANSGAATFWKPGNSNTGTLRAGNLEMSNVDISKEFTDMITTQRGFQANTRIITVSDEMLQELVNLKR